jgi:hypothetical protein
MPMNAETLFSLAGTAVLPGWLLLIFLPRWKLSARLVSGFLIPALLGLVYAWLVATRFASSDGGFGSLADVRLLFDSDYLLLAGWIHYLAFDLFIGSWEVRDSMRRGIRHLLVVPCLLLTFLFGPVGLVLYLAIRTAVMPGLLRKPA